MSYTSLQQLSNILRKYFIGKYLSEISVTEDDGINNLSYYEDYNTIPLFTFDELLTEVPSFPTTFNNIMYVIDGSSRSFKTINGNISIASIAISSNLKPIIGVYPGLGILKEILLDYPFIAIATSTFDKKFSLDPFIYENKLIKTYSPSGRPYTLSYNVQAMETELRQELETKALEAIISSSVLNDLIVIDGPLFPQYIFVENEEREVLFRERYKVISSKYNIVGIVKRLDKSKVLIRTLTSTYRNRMISQFNLDPMLFLSDESLIHSLILKRNQKENEYIPIVIGPLLRKIGDIAKVYMYYVIIPLSKYLPNFVTLRIESLKNLKPEEIITYLVWQEFSKDGIPKLLALADNLAKKVTSGIVNYLIYLLRSNGIELSYNSKIGVQLT
ncbi:MAG: DNA double-strand break repair nuclease NurA [Sulfolobus sp.]|nr:DNA double-strand break repair nuclease NurA [Sulfolobus sp.]